MSITPHCAGAQDFLPDFEHSLQWQSVYMSQPKYSPLFSAMRKVKEWMQTARVSCHVRHSVLRITCYYWCRRHFVCRLQL